MRITRAGSAVLAGIAFVVLAATPVPQSGIGEWSSSALASGSEQNSHAAASAENANEHACREPAGERSRRFNCFTSFGPIHFAGRVRALVVRPDDPNTVWAATASGGLWSTHDLGGTWNPANDQLESLAFSSLAIDPRNPNIMYAGSGEIHTTLHQFDSQLLPRNLEIGSDAGLNLRAPRRGVGIFKTLDGGAHWSVLTGTFGRKDFFYVSRIAVSPQNSNIVLAATATGLWRSRDGGANWARALGRINLPLGVSFLVPLDGIFLDVKFHPQSQGNVIATGLDGQTWFSTDGSTTFNQSSLPPPPAGIPANLPSRIELAFLPNQAGVWFAGAWTGYGFHEDGLQSGLAAAASLRQHWAAQAGGALAGDATGLAA